MNKKNKELMKKYNIKSVGGGTYGKGFFDCLRAIDEMIIHLFNNDHIVKRIEFAKKNKLDYDWVLNQLNNDYKRGIGKKKTIFRTGTR